MVGKACMPAGSAARGVLIRVRLVGYAGNMNLAFIGLGKMGSCIAYTWRRAGHSLAVYNRSPEKAQALAGEGARVASSPADACRDAEAVMTMVSDDHALDQIVFGNDGMADAMQEH